MPRKKKSKIAKYTGKRQFLPLDVNQNEISKLADWLEISAWAQTDSEVSRQEIVTAFNIASNNVEAEQKVHQIWHEIITRTIAMGDSYPFRFSNNKEIFKFSTEKQCRAYIFCLLLSYFGQPKLNTTDFKVASVFEHLCTHVSENFISDGTSLTQSLQFGSPRSGWGAGTRGFNTSLEILIKSLNHGKNIVANVRGIQSSSKGDGGLDVVAWRRFPDNKKGMLLFLGQCATAQDLRECVAKVNDLDNFTTRYVSFEFSKLLGWFVPHIVSSTNDEDHKYHWEVINQHNNIPFDRTRIIHQESEWNYPRLTTKLRKWKKEIQKEARLR
jgi:hypothetical protein